MSPNFCDLNEKKRLIAAFCQLCAIALFIVVIQLLDLNEKEPEHPTLFFFIYCCYSVVITKLDPISLIVHKSK